LSVKILDVFR